jgi:hypothetical protein
LVALQFNQKVLNFPKFCTPKFWYVTVSLWSVERIGRSIARSFEFFPWAMFFQTVQAKSVWPVSQTSLTGLSLVGCRKEFFSEKFFVVLWLFLFRGGVVFEEGFLSEGFLKPVWPVSPACWKAKSHRSSLTGL